MSAGTEENALHVAQRARFRESQVLRNLIRAQGCRCAGCGQILELGSAVLTIVDFPTVNLPAAAHAECRDGLQAVRDWTTLAQVLAAQLGGDSPAAAAANALKKVHDYWLPNRPVGDWTR